MSYNLVETAKNYFSSEFINQASSSLGESSSGISKALSAIVPTSLAGVLSHATDSTDGANSVFTMAKAASANLSPSPTFSNLKSHETKGGNILYQLFGSNQSNIISKISHFAGIKDSSAGSLFNMGIPAIMGLLGKHAEQNNLNSSGLTDFISSQKDHIMGAMPSGLSSLTSMFGLGALESTASSMASNIKSSVADRSLHIADKPNGSSKWLIPLILVIAIIAGLFFFLRTCNKPADKAADSNDTSNIIIPEISAPAITVTTIAIKVKLPNGKELNAFKGGIEDQLVTFLNSNWKAMSDAELKEKWFNFDNLNFDIGKATLLPASENQLDNLAEILKAFPDAKLKIGGYTDALGNPESNKKLSQDRANAAKAGLEKRGVGSQIIDAEGYGSQFAKAAATAPDAERALDRHVSVSVRK
jgi:outer membrane protein OmpA-like peptidoglycan-associated protein